MVRYDLIDISQELFGCRVFPGDPAPIKETVSAMARGDVCNVTAFSMCAHNGTHVDAPNHFIPDGATVDQMGLAPYVGPCYVAHHTGAVTKEDARQILDRARAAGAPERLLIAGDAVVTVEAAVVFARHRPALIANESQTFGTDETQNQIHRILLGAGISLLEGVVLSGAEEGAYFLCAAPLNLGGCDGAPCRALLIRDHSRTEAKDNGKTGKHDPAPLTACVPQLEEMWFKQQMMADEETMAYNHAWGGTIPFPRERWQAWYDRWIVHPGRERYYRYLKDESGRFVGEMAYHYDSEEGCFLADVIIKAAYRGKGYGSMALDMLCAAARENGITQLYDDIAADNPAAAMFIRHGFYEVRRTGDKIILKKDLQSQPSPPGSH